MATPKHLTNPWIPKPIPKEKPVVEELVHPEPVEKFVMKQDIPVLIPNYNTLYGTLRTKNDWRFSADQYANGTVTTVAGSAVIVDVDMTLPGNNQGNYWHLDQWPGGTQLFLFVRSFSLGPQTANFATAGEIDVVYQDEQGNSAPLGTYGNNAFYPNQGIGALMPGAITDSGQSGLGSLSFTLNSGATVGTYSWQMGFSAAYLLPALKGYSIERIGDEHKHASHSHNNSL